MGDMDMKIDRAAAFAPRTQALAEGISQLQGPCVGCVGCNGLCNALIEAILLPELILSKGRAT